jgi:hypothetical protein
MTRAKIPQDAKILIELGKSRPEKVSYDTFRPFKILWVLTNGRETRNYLWVTIRKSGIYCAFGGPGNIHTSYHSDGKFHWKVGEHTEDLGKKPPLPNIPAPILIQNSTTVITDEALETFQLTNFQNQPVDRVIYLDNRMLPEAVCYDIWLVPPFRHCDVPLLIDWPAHIHIITHTNPWIQAIIYEQGKR